MDESKCLTNENQKYIEEVDAQFVGGNFSKTRLIFFPELIHTAMQEDDAIKIM